MTQRNQASSPDYSARSKKKERTMCSPATCEKCNKVTWAGCGQHIEEALAGFTDEQLCHCND
jgi:hypothetical protein